MQEKMWSDFNSLPIREQRQVADFIAFLRQRYQRSSASKPANSDWENDPFLGMWKEREEMTDSGEWVRQIRKKEWG